MASPLFVLSAPLVPWLGSVGALAPVRGTVGRAGRPVLAGRPRPGRGPALRACWACGTSPTTASASSRSSGRSRARSPKARIIALNGEAGFQADLLRGGLHFGLWRWQYRIHKVPLVTIPQGKIGYVYARDGEPLPPSQTLGRVVACNNFQDARAFLVGEPAGPDSEPSSASAAGSGRSCAKASTPSTWRCSSSSPRTRSTASTSGGAQELKTLVELAERAERDRRLQPGRHRRPDRSARPAQSRRRRSLVDSIGIVTVHDGPSLPPGEIIAPAVGNDRDDPNYHNNYQDPEAFLRAGGRRGRQYVPLTDGTYFINRWFATVEMIPKTVVPIGYVGVVVSYYGRTGQDLSGDAFRHGERVAEGERGVWERPLGPGQVPVQHLRRQHRPGADDELRAALDHRQDRGAPLRREPAVDRPGDQGRLRAAAAAVGGRAHRLPEGARASSSGSAT